ncbi:hypothetical protein C8R48DRAFT_774004 [Suillus tomentosus]|nr:hypothetical protein C8R48DRAFT_774004 [Suillus tomentosus]
MSSVGNVNDMFRNFERLSPKVQEPTEMFPQSERQSISRHDDGVEQDELSDGSEYNPKSRDTNGLTVKKPKGFNVGRQRGGNKMKLDRKKRALVRALVELRKWDHKEIAAVFDVSLLPIKRTVANDYPSVDDKPWEDAKFYEKSDLKQLISTQLSAAKEKQKKPNKQNKQNKVKKQDRAYVRSPNKTVVAASPPASAPMEVESDSNTTCSIFRTFRNEAILVHGEKVHSILEEIGIEDDETMFAVLIMDDERLNGMLQEAKRLNLVEKYSVIQALRNFGEKHKIGR